MVSEREEEEGEEDAISSLSLFHKDIGFGVPLSTRNTARTKSPRNVPDIFFQLRGARLSLECYYRRGRMFLSLVASLLYVFGPKIWFLGYVNSLHCQRKPWFRITQPRAYLLTISEGFRVCDSPVAQVASLAWGL